MRLIHTSLFALSLVFLAGCGGDDDDGGGTVTDSAIFEDTVRIDTNGSDTNGTDTNATDTATSDATPTDTATSDATSTDSGSDTSADASGPFTLTVQNYLAWCTVSVNGGATSVAATQTVTVPKGTVVNLVAEKASATFVWGYWFGTAGDTTATHDTAKTTTVTVNKDTLIQACCPFAASPGTPCPAPTP